MKRKIMWLIVSSLMVISLVLTSCAPAAPPEEKPAPPVTEKPAPSTTEKPTPPVEEKPAPQKAETPKYGGMLNLAIGVRVIQMDQASGQSHQGMWYNDMTFDPLTKMAWEKGPAGTGESGMLNLNIIIPRFQKGALAESWEFPDPGTIIVHLRKGVHFHNKPPVKGRELVADDVVFTENRLYYQVPKSYLNVSFTPDRKPQSVKAIDKYTVEVKVVPGMAGEVMRGGFDFARIEPHEVIDTYGNMEHWTRLIGTGPFIIKDHIEGSVTTFERNPNYWETDPVGPGKGNQLPYVDGVKIFLIEDASTRQAALRTGKLDHLTGVDWEQWKTLSAYTPDLKYGRQLAINSIQTNIFMRTDTKPFDDIRVRRALCMAVDQKAMLKELYGGDGELISMPVTPFNEYKNDLFVSLDELPETAREQFEYNPEKAKQLLAEAGYPNGFKTEVLCALPGQVDVLSIVAAYLADIGVDMKIDKKEYGVFVSLAVGKKYPQMVMAWGINNNPLRFHNYRTGSIYNFAILNDARVMEIYNGVPVPTTDAAWKEMVEKFRPIISYVVDQAWTIQLPNPYYYTMWWPWLKNYHGEVAVSFHHEFTWVNYVWLDRDLKEKMTGRR